MAYVYRHIRLDKNVPFYIGKASRLDRAYSKQGRNKKWEEIVKSTNYEVEVILSDLTSKEASKKEREFIMLYKPECMGGTLCNNSPYLDEKTKTKISELKKGKSTWNKGLKGVITRSDETKKKISESSMGKKMSDEAKRKMSFAKKNITEETRKKLSEATRKRYANR